MISNKEIQDAITAYLERTMPEKHFRLRPYLKRHARGNRCFLFGSRYRKCLSSSLLSCYSGCYCVQLLSHPHQCSTPLERGL